MTKDIGRSLRDGLSQAEPKVSALRASIPSADLHRMLALLHRIIAATHSHIDGRDLLGEIHPRKTLDIKRRVDGRETWHEGDWLTTLQSAVNEAKAFLWSRDYRQHRFASGIAAGTDETLRAAQPEGQEPGPQGDATPTPRGSK